MEKWQVFDVSWGWIEKLKDDQREAKAEIAVLVITAFPKKVNNFAYINGIWVTNYTLAICLAVSLRMNLIQVASAPATFASAYPKSTCASPTR